MLDSKIHQLLSNWGVVDMGPMERLAEEFPDRFDSHENGYNNTHEALQCLRMAALHLTCARLNGQHSDELEPALGGVDVLVQLMDEICQHDDFVRAFSSTIQMQKRFQRVWRGAPHVGTK